MISTDAVRVAQADWMRLTRIKKQQCAASVAKYLLAYMRAMGFPHAELDTRSTADLNRIVARVVRNEMKHAFDQALTQMQADAAKPTQAA
ncbi:hypothetical protein [Caballeronia glebae]|uniref:hypothetical protein n=1 Tax=Caballeronia glebae TaxID=1777143 RepID=UPI0038BBF9FF